MRSRRGATGRRGTPPLIALSVVVGLVVTACGGAAPTAPAGASPRSSAQPGASTPIGGVGGGSVDISGPFTPVDLQVALDTAHTAEALIPVGGGVVTATGDDGTMYTLEIPADALLEATTIGLTPATSATGLPFGGDRTYAVQMSPDGLTLFDFATLTIVPAQPLPVDHQVVFGYVGAGKDVIAAMPVVDSPDIKVRLLHFSGAGVSNGSLPTVADGFIPLGSDAERRLESAMSELLQAERAKALAGTEPDGTLVGRIGEILDQYEEEVVNPRVEAAGDSCDAGKSAVQTMLTLERNRQLFGLTGKTDFTTQFAAVLNKTVRACVLEEFETCVEEHRIYLMLPIYLTVLRQQALFPVLTPGTLAEARDLTIKCLTFKLKLDSTSFLDQAGFSHESHVTAELILRLNPEQLLIGGSGEYVNTEYSAKLPGCTIVAKPGGGIMAVLGLIWVFELGAKDSSGNYPNAGITDYELTYSVGNSGEMMSIQCPDSVALPMSPYPVWSICYYDARVDQIDTTSGLRETKWDLESPGDELLATKEWHLLGKEDPNCSEEGTFELRHAPGA